MSEDRPEFALSLPRGQIFEDIPQKGQRGVDTRRRCREYDEARRAQALEAGRRAMRRASPQSDGAQ